MAKFESFVSINIDEIADIVKSELKNGSFTTILEDVHKTHVGGKTVYTQVFERYSILGGNRMSLAINYYEHDGCTEIAAIATRASQGAFFKVNT